MFGRCLCLVAAIALGAFGATARADGRFFALLDLDHSPLEVGPTPAGTSGTDAGSCAGCHEDIAAEWRSSFHASAWTNDVFQASYAIEPRASCRRCHAPLGDDDAEPVGLAADEGISCAVCHVRDGAILGTGRTRSHSPHPVRVAAIDTSRFCASCHEFDFPDDVSAIRSHEPMQLTYSEWESSSAARDGVQCQQCHMPMVEAEDGSRHRSHAFRGGHDIDMLRRAVHVEATARRDGDDLIVEARVRPDAIGHSFPTGDLFRRVELRIELEGDPSSARTYGFARVFRDSIERTEDGRTAVVRRQIGDTRVAPPGLGEPEPILVRFPGAARASARYTLSHLLMPTPMAASQGLGEARVSIVVATGLAVAEGASP